MSPSFPSPDLFGKQWKRGTKWKIKRRGVREGCLDWEQSRTGTGGKADICLLVRRKAEARSALERGTYSATPWGSGTQVFLVTGKGSAESFVWLLRRLGAWKEDPARSLLAPKVSLVLYEVAKWEKKDSRTGEGDLAGI